MEAISDIETYLRSAERFYRDLPTIAQEIASWDEDRRWDYTDDEIPTVHFIMGRLKKWEPEMSAEERARLERLKELETKYARLVDKVLGV